MQEDKLTEAIAAYNAHTAKCEHCKPDADWTKSQLCWRGQNALGVIRFESAVES